MPTPECAPAAARQFLQYLSRPVEDSHGEPGAEKAAFAGAPAAFAGALCRPVVAFHGEMGAGKTTFISALCRLWGVSDAVASPSFAIVNEYRQGDGSPLYHFDFYRLSKLQEAIDLGAEEYFWSGRTCLVEWPDLVADLLPEELTLHVNIEADPVSGCRTISFQKP